MGTLLRRLRYVLTRNRADAELAEEIEFHRAMMNPATRRDLGNVTLAREDARAVWIWPWLESLWQDSRLRDPRPPPPSRFHAGRAGDPWRGDRTEYQLLYRLLYRGLSGVASEGRAASGPNLGAPAGRPDDGCLSSVGV